jgi:hypothetical protein
MSKINDHEDDDYESEHDELVMNEQDDADDDQDDDYDDDDAYEQGIVTTR